MRLGYRINQRWWTTFNVNPSVMFCAAVLFAAPLMVYYLFKMICCVVDYFQERSESKTTNR